MPLPICSSLHSPCPVQGASLFEGQILSPHESPDHPKGHSQTPLRLQWPRWLHASGQALISQPAPVRPASHKQVPSSWHSPWLEQSLGQYFSPQSLPLKPPSHLQNAVSTGPFLTAPAPSMFCGSMVSNGFVNFLWQ